MEISKLSGQKGLRKTALQTEGGKSLYFRWRNIFTWHLVMNSPPEGQAKG